MSNFRQRVELFANIAILIVCVLAAAAFIDRLFFKSPEPVKNETAVLKNGTKLPLDNIEWKTAPRNLLLAVSKTCHFCTESIPSWELREIRAIVSNKWKTGVVRLKVE